MRKVPNPIKILLALAAFIAVSFQGCSGQGVLNAGFFSGKANPGNGTGYEGVDIISPGNGSPAQMFLLYHEDGDCADQRPKSSIRYSGGVYTIERFDCEQILPVQPVDHSQITVDTQDPLILYYGGRTFRQR